MNTEHQLTPIEVVGFFIISKYRTMAGPVQSWSTTRLTAARNMRKQGYPLNIALLVLGRV